jgi:hypothetical protein
MFRAIFRRLTGALSRQERVKSGRDRAFQSFFEAVRSGRLKPADALPVWERLENFELRHHQLVSGKLSRQGGQELLVGYNYLADYVGAVSRSLIHPDLGRSRSLHPQRFQCLYNGVASGNISCDELKQGASLRRQSPTGGSALLAKLWGDLAS